MGEEIKLEVKEKTVEEEAEWDAKDERATAAREKRGGSCNHWERERELQAHMSACHLSVSHSPIDLVARSLPLQPLSPALCHSFSIYSTTFYKLL